MSDKPPIPTWATIIGVLAAVALIFGAFLLGRSLGTPPPDEEVPPLVAPATIGGLNSMNDASTAPVAGGEKEILRARYTDGTNTVLLLRSRPEPDLEAFLTDAGVTNIQAVPQEDDSELELMCGTSQDTGFNACADLIAGEATLIYGLTEFTAEEIQSMLEELRTTS